VLACATSGLAHEEGDEEGDDGAGDGGDDEGHAPAEVLAYGATDEVAERRSDGDGDVEDGEDAVALIFGVEVGKDRGGEDAEAGFADTERGVAEVERVVGVDGGGEEVDAGPKEGGDDDHWLAGEAVAEPAGDRRGEHVGEHEPEGERAYLLVGDEEFVFDLLLDAGEDVAVDVVDEVEGSEKDECGGGSGDGGVTGGFGGGGHRLRGRIAGEFPGLFFCEAGRWFYLGIWGFPGVLLW